MRYLSIVGLLVGVFLFSSCRTRPEQSSLNDIRNAKMAERCDDNYVIVTCNDGWQELKSEGEFDSGNYCRDFRNPQWVHAGVKGAEIKLDRSRWYQQYPSCRLAANKSARVVSANLTENSDRRLIVLKLGAIAGCPLWVRGYINVKDVTVASVSPDRRPYSDRNTSASEKKHFTCKDIKAERRKFPGYLSYY